MNNIKRINLYGAPCSGKSTIAAHIFSQMKRQGYDIEQVTEFVKPWAAEGREINYWDQIYIFGQQHQAEYRWLKNNTHLIVTDCPLLVPVAYTRDFICNDCLADDLLNIAVDYERDYPSLNILIERDHEYQFERRYHDVEASKEIHQNIIKELTNGRVEYKTFKSSQIEEILGYIKNNIKK